MRPPTLPRSFLPKFALRDGLATWQPCNGCDLMLMRSISAGERGSPGRSRPDPVGCRIDSQLSFAPWLGRCGENVELPSLGPIRNEISSGRPFERLSRTAAGLPAAAARRPAPRRSRAGSMDDSVEAKISFRFRSRRDRDGFRAPSGKFRADLDPSDRQQRAHFRSSCCMPRTCRRTSTSIAVSKPIISRPLMAITPDRSRHSRGSRMSPKPSVVKLTSEK